MKPLFSIYRFVQVEFNRNESEICKRITMVFGSSTRRRLWLSVHPQTTLVFCPPIGDFIQTVHPQATLVVHPFVGDYCLDYPPVGNFVFRSSTRRRLWFRSSTRRQLWSYVHPQMTLFKLSTYRRLWSFIHPQATFVQIIHLQATLVVRSLVSGFCLDCPPIGDFGSSSTYRQLLFRPSTRRQLWSFDTIYSMHHKWRKCFYSNEAHKKLS